MATILFHEEDGAWWVESPDYPGCFASGASFEECKETWLEALELWRTEEPMGA